MRRVIADHPLGGGLMVVMSSSYVLRKQLAFVFVRPSLACKRIGTLLLCAQTTTPVHVLVSFVHSQTKLSKNKTCRITISLGKLLGMGYYYTDLPDEVLLRIFLAVGKKDLLTLRLVSHACNSFVLDTPLGIAWEYSIKLAKSTAKRSHHGLPVEQSIHTSMHVGGTIMGLLYSDYQKNVIEQKAKKAKFYDTSIMTLPSWLRVEMHKRQATKLFYEEFEEEIRHEVFEHAEKVDYVRLYTPAPAKPGVMVSQFVIPFEKLNKLHGVTTDLVITCEFEARATDIGNGFAQNHFLFVSCCLGFSFGQYGTPEYKVFEYNDVTGEDYYINRYSIVVLWDLLGVKELGRCEVMRLLNILAVAGFVEADISFTWWVRDDISDELEQV